MAVSELPGNPNAVWTVKIREEGRQLITAFFFMSFCFVFRLYS